MNKIEKFQTNKFFQQQTNPQMSKYLASDCASKLHKETTTISNASWSGFCLLNEHYPLGDEDSYRNECIPYENWIKFREKILLDLHQMYKRKLFFFQTEYFKMAHCKIDLALSLLSIIVHKLLVQDTRLIPE